MFMTIIDMVFHVCIIHIFRRKILKVLNFLLILILFLITKMISIFAPKKSFQGKYLLVSYLILEVIQNALQREYI